MGHSYKGGAVSPGFKPLENAPVLTATAGGGISWVYNGQEPDNWWAYLKTGAVFLHNDTFPPGDRSEDGLYNPGDKIYLQGVSNDNVPQTKSSNTVTALA